MAQIVKWGYLGAAMVTLLTLALALFNEFALNDVVTNFGSSMQGFISSAGSAIQNVRGAFNYLLGSSIPMTIALYAAFVFPFAYFGSGVLVAAVRWLAQ